MYIRKQPSGNRQVNVAARLTGRGEYEISEQFARTDGTVIEARRLRDRRLVVKFGVYGYRETGNIARGASGKTRIRLLKVRQNVHLARQVQAALLFPKSRRDESGFIGGEPTIWYERYIVRKMHFSHLKLEDGDTAFIQLGDIELDNGSQTAHVVKFRRRIRLVERLHNRADRFPDAIKSLLKEHREMLAAEAPIAGRGEEIVAALMQHVADNAPDYNLEYVLGGDVVPVLIEMIEMKPLEEPADIELIPPEDVEIRLREAAKWRRFVAIRGPESAKFRRAVREAYDSTCIVCGIKLPLSTHCRVPGVDSAHILPWATHDLDVVSNGICLCKLHHWAFDQQLIAITGENGNYFVNVTGRAANALDAHAMALLRANEGQIPTGRLPKRGQDRPNLTFLNKLYELLTNEG